MTMPSEMDNDALVRKWRNLIYKVMRSFSQKWLDRDDLFQHGAIGLLRAAEKFDPDRGLSFVTFAAMHIRWEMANGVRQASEGPQRWTPNICSLDNTLNHDSKETFAVLLEDDSPRPDEVVAERDLCERLHEAIERLPDRNKEVIVRCDLGGETQEDVAEDSGVTGSAISLRRKTALRKLRRALAA